MRIPTNGTPKLQELPMDDQAVLIQIPLSSAGLAMIDNNTSDDSMDEQDVLRAGLA